MRPTRSMPRRAAPLLLAAGLSLGAAAAVPGPLEVALPATFEKMWYRSEDQRAFKAKQAAGDVTVSTSSLDFVGKNETMIIPLTDVRAVALGRMEGDVDTTWVVVELATGGRLGFRDGRRLGFGKRTDAFLAALRAGLARADAGPYDVPAGFRTYDGLDSEFTVAIPDGWSVVHERLDERHGRVLWGDTLVVPLASDAGREERAVAIADARAGRVAHWRLVRTPAGAGMACDGFGPDALPKVRAAAAAAAGVAAAALQVESVADVGGCAGLRLAAAAGDRGAVEVHAAADGDVLFLLAAPRPVTDEASAAYAAAVDTFRIAIAH